MNFLDVNVYRQDQKLETNVFLNPLIEIAIYPLLAATILCGLKKSSGTQIFLTEILAPKGLNIELDIKLITLVIHSFQPVHIILALI